MGVFSLTGWCRQIHTGFLRSRATQDTVRPTSLLVRGYHPLRQRFPNTFRFVRRSFIQSYNPGPLCEPVWAVPLSLATTHRITIVFFSSRYLDVSVPGVRYPQYSLKIGYLSIRVFPFGHLRIIARLQLPVAFRSLPRPSSPPRAKASPIRPYLLPILNTNIRIDSPIFALTRFISQSSFITYTYIFLYTRTLSKQLRLLSQSVKELLSRNSH